MRAAAVCCVTSRFGERIVALLSLNVTIPQQSQAQHSTPFFSCTFAAYSSDVVLLSYIPLTCRSLIV